MIEVSIELARYRDGGRSKVADEGRCRMCLRPKHIRRLTRHHLVPQRWFNQQMQRLVGDAWTRMWRLRDAEANVVPLCWPCHREVEKDEQARKMLRKVLAAQEATFVVKLRGQRWFDRVYPPSRRPAAQRLAA